MQINNEELSINTDNDNKEVFNDNILTIANEFKSLITKMETELTNVKTELTSVKKELKEIKNTSIIKSSLSSNDKKVKVTFVSLLKCQATKKEIPIFVFAILGSLVAGCAMPLISLLLGDVIDGFDGSIPKEKVPSTIHGVIVNFCLAGTAIFVGSLLMVIFWTVIGTRLSSAIKVDYFRVIMKQEQSFFDSSNTFEFATKIQTQTKLIENGIGTKVGVALSAISQFVISFIIGYITSWKLSIVITAMLPLLGLGGWFMASAMKQGTAEMRTYEKAGGMAEEILYQIKTVASFANFDYEIERYQSFLSASVKAGIAQGFKSGFGIGFIIFVIYASYALAIGYGSKLISDPNEINSNTGKKYGAGEVITVLFAIIFGCFSLGQAAPNLKAIFEACNAAQDYFVLKSMKPRKSSRGKDKPKKDALEGHLMITNLTFRYPSSEKAILNKINIDFETGKKVAIVGPSGIGKSTILSLIERFYEIDTGAITLDGKNIKSFDINYWRSLIGYVPQEPVLFNTSIRENIIFGRDGVTDDEILAACEKAYATEIIKKKTLDYIVGVKGEKLSGGQRQRIAIARAVLMKPKLLILDEATSALDNKSEKEVQKALDKVSEGISAIIVAHKIDTIKNSHKILCFDKNGTIAEEGTHEELLEKNGVYAELYNQRKKREDDLKMSRAMELEGNKVEEEYIGKLGDNNNTLNDNSKINKSSMNNAVLNVEEIRLSNHFADRKKSSPLKKHKNSLSKTATNDLKEDLQSVEGNSSALELSRQASSIKPLENEIKIEKELLSKSRKHVFEILKNHKCFIAGSSIFASFNGAVWPIYGVLLANAIGVLSKADLNEVKHDGMIIAFGFLALAFCAGVVLWMQNYFFYGLGEILTNFYRREIYEKFLNLHIGFFDLKENSPGAMLTKLSSDTTKISGVATSIIGQLLQTGVTLILGIVIAMVYQWKICLINIAFMPLVIGSYVLQFQLQKGADDGDKAIDEDAGSILSEAVINTKTIFSYSMQDKIVEMYADIIFERKKNQSKRASCWRLSINGVFYSLTQFVIFAMYATLFYVGGNIYQKDESTFTEILRAIFTILFSALGVGIAQMFVGDYAAAKKSIISLQKILDTKSEIDVQESKFKGKPIPFGLKGKIEFKNVKFRYKGSTSYVFRNLNFTINPGEQVAFVGASGAGKSTIISLIERFYDVTDGQILIDDVNIKDYNLIDLRKRIGIVLQQPALFNRTIRENIRYGRLDCDDEEIDKAAKEANIQSMLIDDETNEINVSGGEKQRIAIARAILKNPNILLLDEATSALDKENEEAIKESLKTVMKSRTSVIVAHRLSTIIGCDKIFVLQNGEIIEAGTHNELIHLNGKYAELYKESSS